MHCFLTIYFLFLLKSRGIGHNNYLPLVCINEIMLKKYAALAYDLRTRKTKQIPKLIQNAILRLAQIQNKIHLKTPSSFQNRFKFHPTINCAR